MAIEEAPGRTTWTPLTLSDLNLNLCLRGQHGNTPIGTQNLQSVIVPLVEVGGNSMMKEMLLVF